MKRTTKPSPTDDQGIKSSKAAKGTTSSAKQREASLSKASNTYVASSKTAHAVDPVLESIQAAGADTADIRVQDLILSELNAARLLNVELTDDPAQFIHLLENRVKEITATRNNVILILDEESGTYRCLNDEQHSHIAVAPRELTWISDTYLQELLGSEQVIHSFLHYKGAVFGIIAVADKLDGTHFNLRDELILEQLSQYLSVQVNHYMAIKKASILPAMQQILLRISSRLLSAVDSPAIFQATLASLVEELPFNAGQYITLDRQTGDGYVVYQMGDDGFAQGMPLFTVDSFSSMMSLFQSQVWSHQYLYLRGETLGDKKFADIFGMPDIQSVLVLPLLGADGQVSGALVLFQQGAQTPLSKEALSVLEQASELIVAACARAQVLEKALEIATTDELTETLNRRGFYSRFQAEVERSRRTQSPISLTMLDVDHFKQINDTYGHLVGDQILRDLSQLLQHNLRRSDILCRFGGEEFVILLPDTTVNDAAELIERLRGLIGDVIFQTDAGPIQITFSAGVGHVPVDCELSKDTMEIISESLAEADEAMYQAKQAGRNIVVQFDDQA